MVGGVVVVNGDGYGRVMLVFKFGCGGGVEWCVLVGGGVLVVCLCHLTDAPISVERYPLIDSKCMDCNVCVENCPAKAIHGNEWTLPGKRIYY